MNGILEYYFCPPGYCRCNKMDSVSDVCSNVYHYDNDDLQCVCDRQGKIYIDICDWIHEKLPIMHKDK